MLGIQIAAAVTFSPNAYPIGRVGLGFGRRASWAVHGSMHGWCMAWCMVGGDVDDVVGVE